MNALRRQERDAAPFYPAFNMFDRTSQPAEYFAYEKFLDSYEFGPWLAHSFTRQTGVVQTEDKLRLLLTRGVLSPAFAERVGFPVRQNFKQSESTCVYASKSQPYNRSVIGYHLTWFIAQLGEEKFTPDFSTRTDFQIITMLIDDQSTVAGGSELEVKKKWRFKSATYRGIQLNRPSVNSRAITQIAETMLDVYKGRPQLALPVYDDSGLMHWPIKPPSLVIVGQNRQRTNYARSQI